MTNSVGAECAKADADAQAGKAQAKQEVETMMTEAGALVTTVKEMIDKAPRGKGTQADLEMLKSDLAGVESSLADAQNSYNAEKYLDAKAKIQSAMTAANDVKAAIEAAMASENMRLFRKRLFSRIVPTVKDIGLWGEGVQKAFADMGAIEFAEVDSDALLEQDNRVAQEFDAGAFVRKSIA